MNDIVDSAFENLIYLHALHRYYIAKTTHKPGSRNGLATESSDNSRLGLASLSELSPVSFVNKSFKWIGLERAAREAA